MEESYFAAANTWEGFKSAFRDVFSPDRLIRVYIIKGGPGTGKSTMMRNIGEKAMSLGHGVVYYYCSSDTDSLDGVLIPELNAAVIDGTAPHMTDPLYPGAVESVVSLYGCFDEKYLGGRAGEIRELCKRKAAHYEKAYKLLSGAGRLGREALRDISSVYDHVKSRAAADKLAARISRSAGKGLRARTDNVTRILHTYGTRGEKALGTLSDRAYMRYNIIGRYGAGFIFCSHIADALGRAGVPAETAFSPLTGYPEEIYALGTYFRVSDKSGGEGETIRTERFISRERLSRLRGAVRLLRRISGELVTGAVEELARAGDIHSELEDIYRHGTDYSKTEEIREELERKLFGE